MYDILLKWFLKSDKSKCPMVLSVYVDHPQYKVGTKLECYELSILRQMIDQETDIRLALVKKTSMLWFVTSISSRGVLL